MEQRLSSAHIDCDFLQQIKVKVPGARKNWGSMRFAGEHGSGLVHPPPFFVYGGYVCFTPSLLARAMPLFTALGFLRSDLKVPVADNHGAKLRIHRRPDRGARAVGAAIPETVRRRCVVARSTHCRRHLRQIRTRLRRWPDTFCVIICARAWQTRGLRRRSVNGHGGEVRFHRRAPLISPTFQSNGHRGVAQSMNLALHKKKPPGAHLRLAPAISCSGRPRRSARLFSVSPRLAPVRVGAPTQALRRLQLPQ